VEYSIVPQDDGKIVSLVGVINEDSEHSFKNLSLELEEGKKIIFNFSQVKSINSLGVRAWVSFLRSLEEGRTILFTECTTDIIMQINMIPSFLGKATVASFYVNYICEICNKEEKKLFETASLPLKTIPPAPKCESDDCGMQTEELEDEYFVFLMR
jgi:anti-anti-sigma regulatory factor